MTGGVGKYGGGQIPEKPADKEKKRPQSKATQAAEKNIEASFEETEKETRGVKRVHSDVTLKANKLSKTSEIQYVATAKLMAPGEGIKRNKRKRDEPERAPDKRAKTVAGEDVGTAKRDSQDEKQDNIRGIPRPDKEPTSWDFELFDTYHRLVSCPLEFFETLDAKSLPACEKIAIYYQDRSEGIDIDDEELNAIREMVAAISKEILETRDDEGVHQSLKAQHIYDMFHPITPVLAPDMEREIFGLLGEKKLVHSAHTTSKEMQEKVYHDISLRRRILFAEAKNAVDQIQNTSYKILAQFEIVKAQAMSGDLQGAKDTAAQIQDASLKAQAQLEIAKAQAMSGDLQGAKTTAAEIDDAFSKAQAQLEIAKAQAMGGDLQGAKDTFTFAIAIAAEIQDAYFKAFAQLEIAKAQAMSGDIQGAKATAAEIQYAYSKKAQAQLEIAKAQAMSGDLQGAKTTASEIDDAFSKAEFQIAIAKAQAMSGDIQGAKATAAQIQYPYSKAQAQVEITKAQAMRGDLHSAMATAKLIEYPYHRALAFVQLALL